MLWLAADEIVDYDDADDDDDDVWVWFYTSGLTH